MKVTARFKEHKITKLPRKGRPFWIEPTEDSWWFNLETKQWQKENLTRDYGRTTS